MAITNRLSLDGPYEHSRFPFGRAPRNMGLKRVGTLMNTNLNSKIGALVIRVGFWVPLYYNCNKEPPE